MLYTERPDGTLESLRASEDDFNLAEGEFHAWGEVKAPEGVSVTVSRVLTPGGALKETYTFRNDTAETIKCEKGACGVWTPLNRYGKTDAGDKRNRCHAHIRCGGTSSWINAVRMNGNPPHLALVLTHGSLFSYEEQRQENSNDRGDLCLLVSPFTLAPGQRCELAWELFFYEDDFFSVLKSYPTYHPVTADTFTFFEGEPIAITTPGKDAFSARGGHHTVFCGDGSFFSYQVLPEKEKLFRARAEFIVSRQQDENGAYVLYDNETHERVCEENPNHNAGRERVGMGLFLAKFLQNHEDEEVRQSLYRYVDFVLREFFDENTGEVFNEAGRNNSRRRLYDNAWYASFFRELYHLDGQKRWLSCMAGALRDLYTHGGLRFYPLALEARDAIETLKKEDMDAEADALMTFFAQNAAFMLKNGTDYPGFEVHYEDNIVVPAGMLTLELYEMTGEKAYLEAALTHEKLHAAFCGFQPDARMHGAALHHWDDFWFGKRGLYGDTYPHYWITAGALFEARLAKCVGDEEMMKRARAAMRTSLSCFFEDGSATCAIVTPFAVNGQAGDFIDPWANDQDWALYHALVFDELCGL